MFILNVSQCFVYPPLFSLNRYAFSEAHRNFSVIIASTMEALILDRGREKQSESMAGQVSVLFAAEACRAEVDMGWWCLGVYRFFSVGLVLHGVQHIC